MTTTVAPPKLHLRQVLDQTDTTCVSIADGVGGPYLVVSFAGRSGPCWVAASASERACDCIRDGRASVWEAIHHSHTGTVEVYRTLLDGSVRESTLLCSQIPQGPLVLSAA